jgi:tRNA pseudouridine55 synthase
LICQKILSRFRKVFRKIKIGYTGTLDPFATGVLPIFFGEGTKIIPYLNESRKTYEASLKLGQETDTLDSDGCVTRTEPIPDFPFEKIEKVLSGLIGTHQQCPPAYSAVKIGGTPLYEYARKGISIEAAERTIEVFSCVRSAPFHGARKEEALQVSEVHFTTMVSRGTYVRVLASDIAQKLGTVGHLFQLRRLASGPFTIETAVSLEEVERQITDPERFQEMLRENFLKLLSEFPKTILETSEEACRFSQGQKLSLPSICPVHREGEVRFVFYQDSICGVARIERGLFDQLVLKPIRGIRMETGVNVSQSPAM